MSSQVPLVVNHQADIILVAMGTNDIVGNSELQSAMEGYLHRLKFAHPYAFMACVNVYPRWMTDLINVYNRSSIRSVISDA